MYMQQYYHVLHIIAYKDILFTEFETEKEFLAVTEHFYGAGLGLVWLGGRWIGPSSFQWTHHGGETPPTMWPSGTIPAGDVHRRLAFWKISGSPASSFGELYSGQRFNVYKFLCEEFP